jgi:recombination protein RecA
MARRLAVPEKTETEDEHEGKIVVPSKDDERWKLLEATIAQIEKKHGKGAIMKLTEMPSRLLVDAIPTGAIELDIALGIGGIPRGRVTEIFG